jgi:hypothetical protein
MDKGDRAPTCSSSSTTVLPLHSCLRHVMNRSDYDTSQTRALRSSSLSIALPFVPRRPHASPFASPSNPGQESPASPKTRSRPFYQDRSSRHSSWPRWCRARTRSAVLVTLLVALALLTFARWPADSHLAIRFGREDAPSSDDYPPPSPRRSPPPPLSFGPSVPAAVRDVDVRPIPRLASGDPDERFLAYNPHSGYHNQRISLENALVLARMLNRTLLVPPVWLGTQIPYANFDVLRYRVSQANKAGLDRCKSLRPDEALPRECIGYFSYTLVSWDYLVDFAHAAKRQPVVDRWNMTDAWLEDTLGIPLEDMAHLKDKEMYEFRLYESSNDYHSLDKYRKRLDVDFLRTLDRYRLLHVGTLFGSSRLRTYEPETHAALYDARKSMVLQNPDLDSVTDLIRDRLGRDQYYSLHLRVGDGKFQTRARTTVRASLESLCVNYTGVAYDRVQELIEASERRRGVSTIPDDALVLVGAKEAGRGGPPPGRQLPPPLRITSRAASPLHPSLGCRGPLHTEEDLLPLNAPLYLATDSRVPLSDASIAPVFDLFPCTFVLSDFMSPSQPASSEAVEQLNDIIGKTRNRDDGVMLGQFLVPYVDAMVAAKGRALVGTPHSTFSMCV